MNPEQSPTPESETSAPTEAVSKASPETPPEATAAVEVQPEPAQAEKLDTLASVEPEALQEVEHEPVANTEAPAKITAPIFVSKSTSLPEILTSIGFGSIFFAYAAVAYLHPEALQAAFLDNPLGKQLGHAALFVEVSMFVNVFLGILLLINRRKTTVYALAGSWLLIIAVFKVLNLV
jgi:hypothetical protein